MSSISLAAEAMLLFLSVATVFAKLFSLFTELFHQRKRTTLLFMLAEALLVVSSTLRPRCYVASISGLCSSIVLVILLLVNISTP